MNRATLHIERRRRNRERSEPSIQELFHAVNPDWFKRPEHLEPRAVARNRINGWLDSLP